MESNENLLSSEVRIDETSTFHLNETAKWAKFLGIAGIILSALIMLLGIFLSYFFSMIYKMSPAVLPQGSTAAISAVYILIGLIFFILSFFIYQFGAKMLTALRANDQATFNESLLHQKRAYRIMGILTIIYLGILALGLVGVFMIIGLKK